MSRSLRQRKARLRKARLRRKKVTALLAVALIATGAATSYATFMYLKGPEPWPTIDTLKAERIGENSIVYAADNSRMGVIQSDQNRTIVKFNQMGEWAPKAAVAIEDRRFYQHNGVDPEGIVRAAMRNAEAGSASEGASTITQQVVRNLYKEIGTEKKLSRKAKEAWLAQQLEQKKQWPKQRILETYLNVIFFGNNAYGIEAASQTYFSKNAADLTLGEAALLVGLPQKPTSYDPFKNPKDSKARRDDVLDAMLGEKMISLAQHRKAVGEEIQLKAGTLYKERRLPYFFDYVEKELIKQYGAPSVRQGGLRIHTTINPRYQRLAETAIRETLNYENDPSAAMVVIDTRSGEIRAMASSEDYETSKFNRAAQAKRQPGSSAKIWVLAAFVRAGINPDTTSYTSRPIKVRYTGTTEWWEPKTYDNSYRGNISVRGATIASDNSVYAQMTLDISPEEVSRTAHKLGIFSPLENVWSIGLGSQVVTPLEQTNFYSTIARGGVRIDPRSVRYLTGPGGTKLTLDDKTKEPRRVMRDWQAAKIVDILEANMTGGTGTGAQIGRLAGGKTGTTDDHKDAWFCGITPELTACVWMGYNIPTPMYSVHGQSVAGGSFPATIWRRFMDPALSNKKYRPWFRAKGTEAWEFYNSTWQDNPGIDVAFGSSPIEPTTAEKPDEDATKPPTEEKPAAEEPAVTPTPPAPPTAPVPPPVTPTPSPVATPPAPPAVPA